jgi:hypothetical protein
MSQLKISSDLLFAPSRELTLGEKIRSYKVDKRHKEFLFFAKCPDEVLDVDVFELPEGGELHIAEVVFGSPKRFLFLKEKNESLLITHVIEMNFNDGFVYASKSCRFVLG